MTKTIQPGYFVSLEKSEKDLIPNKPKTKNNMRLLFKLSGISIAFVFLAFTVFLIINIRSVQTTSHKTAVVMGEKILANNMVYFANRLSIEYGQLILKVGDLEGRKGVSLKHNYKLIDEISFDLGIDAGIFVREGDDYLRISTTIADNAGNRAVDAFLGTGSAAYSSIHSGQGYSGEADILGKNYLAEYRPIFTENGKDVIGILAVGKEMATIGKTINSNTVRHIKKIAAAAFTVFLASIAVYALGCKFILPRHINSDILREKSKGSGGLAKRLTVIGKVEWK
jgi:methyl-accepting chemotaxis protein